MSLGLRIGLRYAKIGDNVEKEVVIYVRKKRRFIRMDIEA